MIHEHISIDSPELWNDEQLIGTEDIDLGEPVDELDPRLQGLSGATRAVIAAYFDCDVEVARLYAQKRVRDYRRPGHWAEELAAL